MFQLTRLWLIPGVPELTRTWTHPDRPVLWRKIQYHSHTHTHTHTLLTFWNNLHLITPSKQQTKSITNCLFTNTIWAPIRIAHIISSVYILTVRRNMKNTEPTNPPRMVVLLSADNRSRNTCIAAKVSSDRASEHTHE